MLNHRQRRMACFAITLIASTLIIELVDSQYLPVIYRRRQDRNVNRLLEEIKDLDFQEDRTAAQDKAPLDFGDLHRGIRPMSRSAMTNINVIQPQQQLQPQPKPFKTCEYPLIKNSQTNLRAVSLGLLLCKDGNEVFAIESNLQQQQQHQPHPQPEQVASPQTLDMIRALNKFEMFIDQWIEKAGSGNSQVDTNSGLK